MTEVNMGGEVIKTDLPAEAVADLQQPAEPAEPVKVEEAPEQPVKPAEAKAEETPAPEPAKEPEPQGDPEGRFTKKPKPIASLLEKKHELETALEAERREKAELEQKLAQLSNQPSSPQSDDDVKALAEEYGIDEALLGKIINTARKGVNPELPKEVQDLLTERQAEKQQAEELKAFDTRLSSLAKTLPNESFSDPKVREKLLELAYSTEKAPDGEHYFKKELSELYFAYIKPEIEPGKPSAEPSQGGTQATKVLDFEEIHNDEAKLEEFARTADSEKWNAYVKWRDAKQGDTPIIRRKI